MTAKIIQIAVTPDTEAEHSALFALLSDGSIWCLTNPQDQTQWLQINPPPPVSPMPESA